jgi:hypothetical protein
MNYSKRNRVTDFPLRSVFSHGLGGYPNFLAGDEPDRVAKSYGPNAGRLVAAKRHYDPDNVFNSATPLPGGR